MLREILIMTASLALIGSGAWLALAGIVLAMFPDSLGLRAPHVLALRSDHLQMLAIAVVLIGFLLFIAGAHVGVRLLV
jgi:hypothetical protein